MDRKARSLAEPPGLTSYRCMAKVVTIGLALRFLTVGAAWAQLDDSWTLTLNGQAVQVNPDGSFRIGNVSAPDQFGGEGPGSAPDFIGDDFVRIIGVSTRDGINRYASTPFFRIQQAKTHYIRDLTITDVAPLVPQSIVAVADKPTLTAIGEIMQVRVTATYPDGTTKDLTRRSAGTSYRISNPAIARIDPNGLVSAVASGSVFLTAVNEGATSALQIDVVPGDPLTTVTGFVQNSDGTPASGLTVSIPGQAPTGVTDANGRFTIIGVATTLGPVNVLVQGFGTGSRLFASVNQLSTIAGGYTDAGILLLRIGPLATAAPLSAGEGHVLALRLDGTLWAWGGNKYGQLGDGTTQDKSSPVPLGSDSDWAAVAAGQQHSLALKQDGGLWAWGNNPYGQLGLPAGVGAESPTRVGADTDWVAIAAGEFHSLALKSDGTLWLSGRNHRGQLGNGGAASIDGFQRLGSGTHWSGIAAGADHTLALQDDGSLWGWGANSAGQVGDGTTTSLKALPVRIGAATDWIALAGGREHSLALKIDGSLWSWGSSFYGQAGEPTGANRTIPTRLGTESDWALITGGRYHSLAVKSDGSTRAWGWNYFGQLGDGTTSDARTNAIPIVANVRWKAVAAGNHFSAALTASNGLWTWGLNDRGQLGRGHTDVRPDPIPIGNQNDWSMLAGGRWHVVGLRTNGTLWSWGFNLSAELGDGTKTGKPFAVQIGSNTNWVRIVTSESHTLAWKKEGTLWAWGDNASGQVGDGSTSSERPVPVRIGTVSNWVDCAAGHSHSLAVRSDGTLWTWGLNNSGQLGNGGLPAGRTTPGQVGIDQDWLRVAAGTSHSLALKTNGTLWAWGNNAQGQLGGGTNSGVGRPLPAQVGTASNWVAVAGGNLFTLALKNDGSLWAWGGNADGQLGNGDEPGQNRFLPTRVGIENDWVAMDAGDNHAVALKASGTLWSWGDNSAGQLGDGTRDDRLVPVRIGGASDWRQFSAGELHTIAVRADGSAWGWGSNQYGQVADPTDFNPGPAGQNNDWGIPSWLRAFPTDLRARANKERR